MQQLPNHRNSAEQPWLLPFFEFKLPAATATIQRPQNHKGQQLVSACFVLL
jgi:hypothetical protein